MVSVPLKNVILWVARILAIFYFIFLALFALDAFQGNEGFWKMFLGFLIHLAPALLVLLILILGWKRPWLTGLSFILLGIIFFSFFHNNSLLNLLIIAGPGILNGLLFLVVSLVKK